MEAPHDTLPFLRELILFLVLAGVLIPLLQTLRINPVLGFLSVGALLGPLGLGRLADSTPWLRHITFPRDENVAVFAGLGVIFLMFMIGLDMSVDRLWAMRRQVFGMGSLQVLLCALAIGFLAHAFGNGFEASVILGLVLAFSSTAIVMQLLSGKHQLGSPLGQASFSILLFQDLAVVPLLVLIAILGQEGESGHFASLLGLATLKGAVTVAVIYLIGRRVVRPLFHQIARHRQSDTFMAITLLTTLGVAALTWVAGLSMEMGALLAGLLIAETEFRHAVEVTIEPFKGLLMGLFFMTVGMSIDLSAILAEPLWLPLSVLGLMLIKCAIVLLLLRAFGLSWGRAAEGGVLLSQGGEFAFIVIGMALALGLIDPRVGQLMLLVVGLSMLVTPVLSALGERLGNRIDARHPPRPEPGALTLPTHLDRHVIIAGYGRVGQILGQLLSAQGVEHVAVESDASQVALLRAGGAPVFFGDASRPELLRKLNLDHAVAVVLTMDHPAASLHATRGILAMAPGIRVVARARDERHALALLQAGASAVIPETLESSLQMAACVFEGLGVPGDVANQLIDQERNRRVRALSPTH